MTALDLDALRGDGHARNAPVLAEQALGALGVDQEAELVHTLGDVFGQG